MLDHLVLATPDLAGTVADFAQRTGVAPTPGGSHTGLGTANALVGLGPDSYLEIVGPDPSQPEPDDARPFGIDTLQRAALVTWAVHPPDIDAVIANARRAGHDPGDAQPMSRRTPDGETLSWRLTPPGTPPHNLVPFLIDWGTTPHPASRRLPAVELTTFALLHPDPISVQAALDTLRVPMLVKQGPEPSLAAVVRTPRGTLVL